VVFTVHPESDSATAEQVKTVDDIYRFTVERTSMARGEFLELTIVLLIILELILLTH
jgi:hypothetical protein